MKISDKNYIIGVTGGVGAGKSTVLCYLENEFGARVYQADRISRSLTLSDGPAFNDVVALFGPEIVMPDGNVDRNKIARVVFRDPEKREALNAIIHPAVRRFLFHKARTRDGIIVFEAALPVEGDFKNLCDEIWYVRADEDTRVRRVTAARGYTEEKAREIIASQLTDAEYAQLSDVIIDNNGDVQDVKEQIAVEIKRINSFFNGNKA